MTVEAGWQLLVALGVLVALGTGVAYWGRVPLVRDIGWAAARAAVQLVAVSLIIGFALSNLWLAFGFVAVMFGIGVHTTCQRVGVTSWSARWSAAVSMAAGAVPVLAVIFGSGAAPLTGPSIVPICSIVVGNMMSAHTLIGRRAYAELRARVNEYEAYLSLGFERSSAISAIVSETLHEAIIPALDQTRTVGLVTLPGAYIGVLLGGGSPWGAAAAQVLVLVGINTGQTLAAVTARWLMSLGLLLPADLRQRLRI